MLISSLFVLCLCILAFLYVSPVTRKELPAQKTQENSKTAPKVEELRIENPISESRVFSSKANPTNEPPCDVKRETNNIPFQSQKKDLKLSSFQETNSLPVASLSNSKKTNYNIKRITRQTGNKENVSTLGSFLFQETKKCVEALRPKDVSASLKKDLNPLASSFIPYV